MGKELTSETSDGHCARLVVSVHSLKLSGEGHGVSVGGLAQPSCVHPTPSGPLTCRLPCRPTGSPALPGRRPGAADSSSTLKSREQGDMNFGATGPFLGFPSDTPLCACLVASVGSDSVTPWPIACQAPLSMGFSRQEYQSGFPCPPPGDLPDPRIEPASASISRIAAIFFTQ